MGRDDQILLEFFELKNDFAFFWSLSRLFLPTYFVKCRRTLLELNFEGPYPSSEREVKFRCCFTYSIKREIRHFHAVVVQKRAKVVVFLIKPIGLF